MFWCDTCHDISLYHFGTSANLKWKLHIKTSLQLSNQMKNNLHHMERCIVQNDKTTIRSGSKDAKNNLFLIFWLLNINLVRSPGDLLVAGLIKVCAQFMVAGAAQAVKVYRWSTKHFLKVILYLLIIPVSFGGLETGVRLSTYDLSGEWYCVKIQNWFTGGWIWVRGQKLHNYLFVASSNQTYPNAMFWFQVVCSII